MRKLWVRTHRTLNDAGLAASNATSVTRLDTSPEYVDRHRNRVVLVAAITSENAADITTLMVSALEDAEPTKNTYVTLEIAGVKVDLLLDTGAQASVINRQNLRRLPPRISLRQTNKRLREFTGAAVPVRGMIVAPVKYGDAYIKKTRFYVVDKGCCVLGQDLFDLLQFGIVDNKDVRLRTVRTTQNLQRLPA